MFRMGCTWASQEEFFKVYGIVSAQSRFASVESKKGEPFHFSVHGEDGQTK
jgi:peptide methionine sulfoxide reductase MsrA